MVSPYKNDLQIAIGDWKKSKWRCPDDWHKPFFIKKNSQGRHCEGQFLTNRFIDLKMETSGYPGRLISLARPWRKAGPCILDRKRLRKSQLYLAIGRPKIISTFMGVIVYGISVFSFGLRM